MDGARGASANLTICEAFRCSHASLEVTSVAMQPQWPLALT